MNARSVSTSCRRLRAKPRLAADWPSPRRASPVDAAGSVMHAPPSATWRALRRRRTCAFSGEEKGVVSRDTAVVKAVDTSSVLLNSDDESASCVSPRRSSTASVLAASHIGGGEPGGVSEPRSPLVPGARPGTGGTQMPCPDTGAASAKPLWYIPEVERSSAGPVAGVAAAPESGGALALAEPGVVPAAGWPAGCCVCGGGDDDET